MPNFDDKDIFIFDVDNTLGTCSGDIHTDAAQIICRLLDLGKVVAFCTDRSKQLLLDKVIALLPCQNADWSNMYLLPAAGAAMYRYESDKWQEVHAKRMDGADQERIVAIYEEALRQVDSENADQEHNVIEKDNLMLSIAVFKAGTPAEERDAWDKDQAKRTEIVKIMKGQLPEYEVHIGGATSVNIAMPGVNKTYGINKFFEILEQDIARAIFIGDAIYPGGNDYCVLETGIDTLSVENPEDTVHKFATFLE